MDAGTGGVRAHSVGLVGHVDELGVPVDVGVDGDGFDSQPENVF